MTTHPIGRRRMRNLGLTGTPVDTPDEIVRRLGAMQSQDYGLAKWSIGQRASGLVDADVDEALKTGSIVRTHVMRPTWHFVCRDDIRWLLALTGPRVQKKIGRRYRELQLDGRTLARAEASIVSALEGANHLTRDAVGEVLQRARIDPTGQRLPYILLHCELEAVVCSGALAGKRHTYALLDERVPKAKRFDRDEALVELVRRYLRSHGPATVQDLSWWSGLTVADLKMALDILGTDVQPKRIESFTFWSLSSDKPPRTGARGVHLLQAFDELIVGYSESRFFGDPRAADARAAWKDRSLPMGVVLIDGRVVGHWKRTAAKNSVRVDAHMYETPKRAEVRALEDAAAELGGFVEREAAETYLSTVP